MTGKGLNQIPKTGGDVVSMSANLAKTFNLRLRLDDENFYFCEMAGNGKSDLMKMSRRTGELKQLAPSINDTMEFVIDDTNVYYFDNVRGQGSFGPVALMKVSKKGGGTPTEIDRGDAGWVKFLAVDARQIYFTDISKVYALPK